MLKNKKKLSLLLGAAILLGTIQMPVMADETQIPSPVTVSYTVPAVSADKTVITAVDNGISGGTGWASTSYWHTGTKPTTDAWTATNRYIRIASAGDNTYYLVNPAATGAGLYRTVAEANYINPTIDADYYISFVSRDALGSMSSVTNNPTSATQSIDHKFYVGSTGLYASFSKFVADDTENKLSI